jgi:hypothetical protein
MGSSVNRPPPAIITRPGSSSAFEGYKRRVLIGAVVDQGSVVGDQISALENAVDASDMCVRQAGDGWFMFRTYVFADEFLVACSGEMAVPVFRTLPGWYAIKEHDAATR